MAWWPFGAKKKPGDKDEPGQPGGAPAPGSEGDPFLKSDGAAGRTMATPPPAGAIVPGAEGDPFMKSDGAAGRTMFAPPPAPAPGLGGQAPGMTLEAPPPDPFTGEQGADPFAPADPFAAPAPAAAPPLEDPFAAPAPSADPFARPVDHFNKTMDADDEPGGRTMQMPGGPNSAPAAPDPFAGGGFAPADPFAAPADPFSAPAAAADPFGAPAAQADPFGAPAAAADPFAAPGPEVDPFAPPPDPNNPFARGAAPGAGSFKTMTVAVHADLDDSPAPAPQPAPPPAQPPRAAPPKAAARPAPAPAPAPQEAPAAPPAPSAPAAEENDMNAAAKTALTPEKRRLGLALLAAGPITSEKLAAELEKSGKGGGVLGRALLASGFPKEEELLAALVAKIRIPKINVKTTKIPLETVRLVPADIAKARKVLPIEKIGDILVVVSPDIGDVDAMTEVRRVTGCLVSPIQCAAEGFDEVLDGYYDRLAQSGMGSPPPATAASMSAPPVDAGTLRFPQGAAAEAVAGTVTALPDGQGDWDDAWAAVYAAEGPVAAEEALL